MCEFCFAFTRHLGASSPLLPDALQEALAPSFPRLRCPPSGACPRRRLCYARPAVLATVDRATKSLHPPTVIPVRDPVFSQSGSNTIELNTPAAPLLHVRQQQHRQICVYMPINYVAELVKPKLELKCFYC